VDRQLIGRGGRQGDPSTWEVIASLDDEMFQMIGRRLAAALRLQLGESGVVSGASALALRQHAQRAAERFHASIRRATLAADRKFDKMLAFSGAPE
jgi:preprotein translocase subunit SecA